jgi:type VI secretion system protein ImpM
MSMGLQVLPLNYFGKLPSQGDFVKSGHQLPLLNLLDNWLAQAMGNLSEEPRWKLVYDQAGPVHFAFLGPRHPNVVVGHVMASRDAAERRFPFVMAAFAEAQNPVAFTASSPLVLSPLWAQLAELSQTLLAPAEAATQALQALSGASVSLDLNPPNHEAAWAEFLKQHTIGDLQQQLCAGGFEGHVRSSVLGLGLLLKPVMRQGELRKDQSLCLPLPAEPALRPFCAAFWLDLIHLFFQHADFGLSLYIAHTHEQRPVLVLGSDSAASLTLESLLNPSVALTHWICFDHADWVDDEVAADPELAKLSSYLEQDRLSLASVCQHFKTVFGGGPKP